MVFSGIPFLYFFLPVVLILYYGSPRQVKNYVLLLSGIVFYFYGEQLLVFLMLFTAFWDYSMARIIDRVRRRSARVRSAGGHGTAGHGTKKHSARVQNVGGQNIGGQSVGGQSAEGSGNSLLLRILLALTLGVDIGILCYFKYTDFFIHTLNSAFGAQIPLLKIALPIGISFYTFQSMSYVIDVYRGEVPVQKNPFTYATYLTLFPQLIAGPIVRYSTVLQELREREHSFSQFSDGVRRFIVGLAKKVLVANILGEFCRLYPDITEKTVLLSWFYAFSYTLQIYFDFSGYSDMAIGLGKMFGFRFLENFNYPFISKSITEFWRRWHISLGTWFRDYVYIPLGGNRKRWLFNALFVWFLTGMWHGAGWNFILWGLYNALFLILEKMLRNHMPDIPFFSKVLSHLYAVPVILIGFMIFAGADINAAEQIRSMFFMEGLPLMNVSGFYFIRDFAFIFVIALAASTPLGLCFFARCRARRDGLFHMLSGIATIALLILCTAEMVDSSFNPFLYFRF